MLLHSVSGLFKSSLDDCFLFRKATLARGVGYFHSWAGA